MGELLMLSWRVPKLMFFWAGEVYTWTNRHP